LNLLNIRISNYRGPNYSPKSGSKLSSLDAIHRSPRLPIHDIASDLAAKTFAAIAWVMASGSPLGSRRRRAVWLISDF
jgi:hypothetical protein